jgi:dUTP pyrophosphatase
MLDDTEMGLEVRLLDRRLEAWGFPTRGSELAAGVDLFACLDHALEVLPQAHAQLISSGLAIQIQDPRWCAMIVPRSGLGHKGLVLGNGVGIVDPDYEGPCLISAWNRNPNGDPIIVNPGDRIAQMLFVRISRPHFKIVDVFSSASKRGARGWGSTDV